MNCCDDFGKCTCGVGQAQAPRVPPCVGCASALGQSGQTLRFAPGAVEGYKTPFFGNQSQRRELKKAMVGLAFWLAVSTSCAFLAGVVAGVWR